MTRTLYKQDVALKLRVGERAFAQLESLRAKFNGETKRLGIYDDPKRVAKFFSGKFFPQRKKLALETANIAMYIAVMALKCIMSSEAFHKEQVDAWRENFKQTSRGKTQRSRNE